MKGLWGYMRTFWTLVMHSVWMKKRTLLNVTRIQNWKFQSNSHQGVLQSWPNSKKFRSWANWSERVRLSAGLRPRAKR